MTQWHFDFSMFEYWCFKLFDFSSIPMTMWQSGCIELKLPNSDDDDDDEVIDIGISTNAVGRGSKSWPKPKSITIPAGEEVCSGVRWHSYLIGPYLRD